MQPDNPTCFANHMGLWLCEPLWLSRAVSHIRAGTWVPEARGPDDDGDRDAYVIAGDGIAVIPMMGPMMKGDSKFGGANTVRVRRALRLAAADEGVRGIMLHIDSPGGHVAGTADLANDVRVIGRRKPIHAHIDDLGASAAVWVASQASMITANATAEVGSVGVIGVLEDSSGEYERAGVEVHVIATGAMKGMGVPGTKVTPAHLAQAEELVGDIFGHFLGALRRGRGMSAAQAAGVSDARMMIAGKAQAAGLIDGVRSFDSALIDFAAPKRRSRSAEWRRLAGG